MTRMFRRMLKNGFVLELIGKGNFYRMPVPVILLPVSGHTMSRTVCSKESRFMCTCITLENGEFYFGRNLDLDVSFGECITVAPRRFPLKFCRMPQLQHHYAMVGTAAAAREFPLYAEAVNEKGLCMAGLNFPGNAVYKEAEREKNNAASFELIAWILAVCSSAEEAADLLKKTIVTRDAFSEDMAPAQLHWMIADENCCIVAEPEEGGLRVTDNPIGVLTNNPPFWYHCINLNNYMNIGAAQPKAEFAPGINLKAVSQGMGAAGLPGDASSVSRFVRAAFLKGNSVCVKRENANVTQMFHILDGVSMVRGSVRTDRGSLDTTIYSCCINAKKGLYYYKTYDGSCIRCVCLEDYDLNGCGLIFDKGKILSF